MLTFVIAAAAAAAAAAQIFHQYVNYARDKQGGTSQAEEDICMGLQVSHQ
jgi:hypothetical protein